MSSKRARDALEICARLMELEAHQRGPVLERVCGDDLALRAEVESLLAFEPEARDFMESLNPGGLDEAAGKGKQKYHAQLEPGTDLGEFRLEREIGRGGMGVVFEAVQKSLHRRVALKVLPGSFALEPRRVERFRREARAAASIHHPSIIPIYDVGEVQGTHFYSMEFIDGPSLAQVLVGARAEAKKEGDKNDSSVSDPAYVANVVEQMAALAEGLGEAHEEGLVHRDIKPSNILLDKGGRYVLVDFGLVHVPESRTLTRSGEVLGTLNYMSPEQVSRQKVDARSDVYSLGVTLYEVLTLRVPFEGESEHEIQNRILFEEPISPRKFNPRLNRDLQTIILHALEKNPQRRYPSAAEFAADLRRLLRYEPIQARAQSALRRLVRRGWRHKEKVAAALIVALALFTSMLAWKLWPEKRLVLSGEQRLTLDPGLTIDPTLSSDGRVLAYASDRSDESNLDIFVQDLEGVQPSGTPRRLTSHPADDHQPALSPDGKSIVFRSDRAGGGVYISSTDGGKVTKLADSGRRPRFSPDGEWVAYWVGLNQSLGSRVYVIRSDGGERRRLLPHFQYAHSPVWSPCGKYLLLAGRGTTDRGAPPDDAETDWWLTHVASGRVVTKTGAADVFRGHQFRWIPAPGQWIPDRNLVLFKATIGDNTSLWAVPLSPETGHFTGEPQQLTTMVSQATHPWASTGGRVVFTALVSNNDLWRLPINADRGTTAGKKMERLTESLANDRGPSISPDGEKLVFISSRSGNDDVWMKYPLNGVPKPLTTTPSSEYRAVISDDGSRVAYGNNGIWVRSLDGGEARKVCEDCYRPEDWSSDGMQLLYLPEEYTYRVNLLNVETGKKAEVLHHPEWILNRVEFSPDDRWIALKVAPDPVHRQIFIAPYHPGQVSDWREWIEVTDPSTWADKPCWSPKGNLLYYTLDHQGFRCIYARRFEQGKLGDAVDVHHLHSARLSMPTAMYGMDVSQTEIVVQLAERTGNIWMAELKEEY